RAASSFCRARVSPGKVTAIPALTGTAWPLEGWAGVVRSTASGDCARAGAARRERSPSRAVADRRGWARRLVDSARLPPITRPPPQRGGSEFLTQRLIMCGESASCDGDFGGQLHAGL